MEYMNNRVVRSFLFLFSSYYNFEGYMFFWNMYSKESPCCGRYIINIKRGKNKALYMLVNPREPQSKNKNKKSLSVLTSEKSLFIVLKSICLQHGHFNEAPLPSLEGRPVPVEACVISLLLDKPGAKHEDLHEELWVKVLSGLYHHHMKREIEVPVNSMMTPALGTERAFEEQVKSSFFYVHSADGTV
jgi:hypothetical protein